MQEILNGSMIELEQSFYHRRPLATFDLEDPVINVKFNYFLTGNSSKQQTTRGSKITGLKLYGDFAVIYAYRIPELILMQLNPTVKFIYVQHGYYPDLITRKFNQVFRKFDRVLLYVKLLIMGISKGLNISLALEMLWLWTVPKFKASKLPQPDLCVILDHSWQSFHENKLGWTAAKYVVKPFYEPKLITTDNRFDFQYICQSLVEDSRITVETLINTINAYVKENHVTNLAMIAHPRTNKDLYRNVKTNITFIEDRCFDVPAFGHYSSLMLYLAENGVRVSVCNSDDFEIPQDFINKLEIIRSGRSRKIYTNIQYEAYINKELKAMFQKAEL